MGVDGSNWFTPAANFDTLLSEGVPLVVFEVIVAPFVVELFSDNGLLSSVCAASFVLSREMS